MQTPMNKSSYNSTLNNILDVYDTLVNDNMNSSANELISEGEESADVMVGFDGSWQKRGYASNNGVVAAVAVENGKCIDFQVETKTCKACSIWENKKLMHPEEYNVFHMTHDAVCKVSHKGSAGSMESSGVVKMFERSENKNRLRYTTFIGDGDSSSYSSVVKAKPYGDNVDIKKGECIGHVQKRVGTRLRNLKKKHKEVLSDGKKLGGAGRLTEKVINTLQNCYGMAIRQNVNDLYGMKKSVAAVLFHYSESRDDETRHQFCLRTETSWCKYQADKLTGKSTYKQKITLPAAVRDVIAPIFKDLGSDSLLKKCLHGKTQNPNESLNQLIWKRCPKDVFVERTALAIGVSSAVLCFNDGEMFLEKVFFKFNMEPGSNLRSYCANRDAARVAKMENQCSTPVKARRKKLRAIRKGFTDRDEVKEGNVYGSG